MLKKVYQPKKYGQPLLDLNMYRDYQGDNHILNLIKKFLKE